mgnify:FL=1
MNEMVEQISEISTMINSLNEIHADPSVPRNVRTKIELIIGTLRKDTELSIKINKTLSELDEIASDSNLQAYTRTQLWNVISMLEKL